MESVEKLFGVLDSDGVDISLRRSAAEQLSVVLQGETVVNVHSSLIIFSFQVNICSDPLPTSVFAVKLQRSTLSKSVSVGSGVRGLHRQCPSLCICSLQKHKPEPHPVLHV